VGQRCLVCSSPERARIELALVRRMPYRALTARFPGLGKDSFSRHKRNHMPPQLMAALRAAGKPADIDLDALRQSESEGLLQHLIAQRGRLYVLLDLAEEVQDVRAASGVHGRIVENLQLTAKLLGEITSHATTTVNNLVVSGEYVALRSALVRALGPHPEASRAVAAVLRDLEGAEPHWTGSPRPPPLIEANGHARA
jgi:hypothetical protein